ncbi:MAG: HIT family protein [Phycisphaerae bacterium]
MMVDTLWAPWRLEYIQSVTRQATGCFLCELAQHPEKDAANFVVQRGQYGMLLMNRYPYVNGHLLAAPYRHASDLPELAIAERAEVLELAILGQQLLTQAMNPQGFNIGINIGRCAGAGVPGHVHIHIVPRWNGDVNFISVVGQVRVIPQALEEAYRQIMEQAVRRRCDSGPAS